MEYQLCLITRLLPIRRSSLNSPGSARLDCMHLGPRERHHEFRACCPASSIDRYSALLLLNSHYSSIKNKIVPPIYKAMEAAGLAVGLVATADLCLK
jgi:hypothetical protein